VNKEESNNVNNTFNKKSINNILDKATYKLIMALATIPDFDSDNNSNAESINKSELSEPFYEKYDARLDASILLAYILGKPRVYINTWPDKSLTSGQIAMFDVLLNRRIDGEPIAYITGHKEFYSLLFKVNKDTLIPRPETEILVDYVLDKYKSQNNIKILDLGTGSGCIAVSIAKYIEKYNGFVTAVDKSIGALSIAKENARLNKVENISFVESYWFSNVEKTKYDCIISNPPYLDKSELTSNIKYEPSSALISDNNGLKDIEEIIFNSKDYLKPNGLLIIEHGASQKSTIEKIIAEANKSDICYKNITFIQDYAGLDRAVVLVRQ